MNDLALINIFGIPLTELMEDPLFMAVMRTHQQKQGVDAEAHKAMKDYLCERCEVKLLRRST